MTDKVALDTRTGDVTCVEVARLASKTFANDPWAAAWIANRLDVIADETGYPELEALGQAYRSLARYTHSI